MHWPCTSSCMSVQHNAPTALYHRVPLQCVWVWQKGMKTATSETKGLSITQHKLPHPKGVEVNSMLTPSSVTTNTTSPHHRPMITSDSMEATSTAFLCMGTLRLHPHLSQPSTLICELDTECSRESVTVILGYCLPHALWSVKCYHPLWSCPRTHHHCRYIVQLSKVKRSNSKWKFSLEGTNSLVVLKWEASVGSEVTECKSCSKNVIPMWSQPATVRLQHHVIIYPQSITTTTNFSSVLTVLA